MTAASPAAATGPMATGSAAARPQISARLPVSDWQIRWRLQPDGRTVLEVTDQAGNLTGLVASTRLPIISVDGAWRGTRRSADGSRQRWALAIGHAYPPDGPLTVTFTRRGRRTIIHPATVDGLWVAAVTGPYTASALPHPGRGIGTSADANGVICQPWAKATLITVLAAACVRPCGWTAAYDERASSPDSLVSSPGGPGCS